MFDSDPAVPIWKSTSTWKSPGAAARQCQVRAVSPGVLAPVLRYDLSQFVLHPSANTPCSSRATDKAACVGQCSTRHSAVVSPADHTRPLHNGCDPPGGFWGLAHATTRRVSEQHQLSSMQLRLAGVSLSQSHLQQYLGQCLTRCSRNLTSRLCPRKARTAGTGAPSLGFATRTSSQQPLIRGLKNFLALNPTPGLRGLASFCSLSVWHIRG